METALHKLLRIGSVASFVTLFTPACVDNNVTLFVRQVQAPDPENSCVAGADPEGLFYGAGILDTSLSPSYGAWVLVGNQMVGRGADETLRPESSRVQLYEADVEVFGADGSSLSEFTIPTTGFVDVGSTTDPAYGLARVTLIDPALGGTIGGLQTVISRIKVYGVTLGDIEVETGYYDYPIEVCNGCIPCVCPDSLDSSYATTCAPGQNEGIDCRLATCWANDYCGCVI